MKNLLETIIANPVLHARWLNTLSYLENCGARKIAACEHPTLVKEGMLKHAAEEFRHAHYLKKQIGRITNKKLPDYSSRHLLGGVHTKNYLHALDVWTCRFLTSRDAMNPAAVYHLVTYGIEVRAEKFYALYHECLQKADSKITVKSIILEEIGHLAEMKKNLKLIPQGQVFALAVCQKEKELFSSWHKALSQEVQDFKV